MNRRSVSVLFVLAVLLGMVSPGSLVGAQTAVTCANSTASPAASPSPGSGATLYAADWPCGAGGWELDGWEMDGDQLAITAAESGADAIAPFQPATGDFAIETSVRVATTSGVGSTCPSFTIQVKTMNVAAQAGAVWGCGQWRDAAIVAVGGLNLFAESHPLSLGVWHTVRVEVKRTTVRLLFDGSAAMEFDIASLFSEFRGFGSNATLSLRANLVDASVRGFAVESLPTASPTATATVTASPTATATVESSPTASPPRRPRIVKTPTVEKISDTEATITWTTDLPSDSTVEYGLTASLGRSKHRDSLVKTHRVRLTGLKPDTVYHFIVKNENDGGKAQTRTDRTFTTAAAEPLPASFDGEWVAITAGGGDFSFTVKNNAIAAVQITYSCGPYVVRLNLTADPPIPLSGTTFAVSSTGTSSDISLEGEFTSPTTATGTVAIRDYRGACFMVEKWTATKNASGTANTGDVRA